MFPQSNRENISVHTDFCKILMESNRKKPIKDFLGNRRLMKVQLEAPCTLVHLIMAPYMSP